jgi:AraC-like DNA-binding protein
MKKLLTLSFLAIAIVIFYNYFKSSFKYNYKEPNIKELVYAKTKNHYLDLQIQKAIKEKKYDDAKIYLDLANEFNITLLPKTKELVKNEFTTTKKLLRGTKEFFNGFISGKANNGTQIAGAITSDFTIYGDLRDVTIEGKKYINDKPYDKLILGLSMAGLALSASTFVTLGSSASIKVGTSALKVAKREKMLTKGFSKTLNDTLNKSIDYKALKSIKLGSIKELKQSSKIVKNSVKLQHLKPILKDLETIKSSTSLTDTIHLLKYVDNSKDLTKIAKVSKKYKKATRGIFKLFGKNIFRLTKVGIKWSKTLIISLAGLILASIAFLITLFSRKK